MKFLSNDYTNPNTNPIKDPHDTYLDPNRPSWCFWKLLRACILWLYTELFGDLR